MTDYLPPLGQQSGADQGALLRRVSYLEQRLAQLVIGAVPCLSTTHPANPATGMEIYETDTGLTAMWSGTAWNYPGVQLLGRVVLGATAATVTLPASGTFPQVFTNLRVVISASGTGTGAAGYDAASMQINGVTASNYSWSSHYMTQGAASVSTAGATAATSAQVAEIWNQHFGSAGQGIATIEIPDYTSTSKIKSWTSLSAAIDGGNISILQTYIGALGSGATAAVSSLKFLMGVGSFEPGSSFSVYGLD